MKILSKKLVRIMVGLFLFALGNVLTINAGLGVSPWVVFDQGIANVLGITVGKATIGAGVVILIIDIFLGQPLGWGSVLNMFFLGFFMDVIMLNNLVPILNSIPLRFIMLFIGVVLQGFATYYYLSGALGAGPRDGLMVALTIKSKRSFRLVKTLTEIIVVGIGYSLGGDLGIGTVIMAMFAGQIFQFVFNTVNFNVSEVKHRYIQDDILYLKNRWTEKDAKVKESEECCK